jgi:hypothetical protein
VAVVAEDGRGTSAKTEIIEAARRRLQQDSCMSDVENQKQTRPRDLQDFQAEIDQMIAQAEAHLGVAHGTIADVANDSDYLAILKIHATIEPLINELLKENITRVLKHPKVNFPGADALAEFVLARNLDEKRTLAVKSELIDTRRSEFIRNVANVRNRYAHNIKEHFAIDFHNRSKNIPERQWRSNFEKPH